MYVKAWAVARVLQIILGYVVEKNVLVPLLVKRGSETKDAYNYSDTWTHTAQLACTACCCCVCHSDVKAWAVAQVFQKIWGSVVLGPVLVKHGPET